MTGEPRRDSFTIPAFRVVSEALLEEIAGLLRDYRELAQEYGLSAAAADAESALHELTGSVQ